MQNYKSLCTFPGIFACHSKHPSWPPKYLMQSWLSFSLESTCNKHSVWGMIGPTLDLAINDLQSVLSAGVPKCSLTPFYRFHTHFIKNYHRLTLVTFRFRACFPIFPPAKQSFLSFSWSSLEIPAFVDMRWKAFLVWVGSNLTSGLFLGSNFKRMLSSTIHYREK